MQHYFWFSLFVAINGLILVVLAGNVSRLRLKYKISYGDGDNKHLLKAIRVHANGMEQVPIFGLVILGLSFLGLSQDYLAALVIIFSLSRISHAIGMSFGVHIMRRVGASLTYGLQIGGSLLLLIQLL
ncbi:MAG: MAPEG family protein [Agarilytica sp.]